MSETILEVRDLRKYFPVTRGLILMKTTGWVKAVDGVSFSISRGETFGLVGESGCGKTTTSKLILLLEKISSGEILFQGTDIQHFSAAELKRYRRSVQPVFQDPYSSLSPRLRVGDIIAEPVVVNDSLTKRAVKERVTEVLGQVGLSPESAGLYPHEFSGGQRQRIAVARALSIKPSVLILDEPVSALDVSIRSQIINLLKGLQRTLGLTYLLITHDLAVVKHMSDRIGVMYLGKLVESSPTDELYRRPMHPYTQALLSAALPSHPDKRRDEILLPGEVPSPLNPPEGCRFHPRCVHAMPVCSDQEPPLREIAAAHFAACHLYD